MEEQKTKVSYWIGGLMRAGHENEIFQDIDQRLTLMEEAVFKKLKRLRATEAQKFLICFHLGLIRPIIELQDLQQKQKDLLVSVMLDIDPTNAKKYLLELASKEKPLLRTVTNYKFLISLFKNLGLEKLEDEAENILTEIKKEQEENELRRKAK